MESMDMNKMSISESTVGNEKSNFHKVKEFNKTMGVLRTDAAPSDAVFKNSKDSISTGLMLINEELGELQEAIRNNDLTETIDAIGDLLYVTYGLADRMNIDIDHYFRLIHESNMTKACTSETEAQATVESYKERYAKKEASYAKPYYVKCDGVDLWIVKNGDGLKSDKVLKSINYKPVNITY